MHFFFFITMETSITPLSLRYSIASAAPAAAFLRAALTPGPVVPVQVCSSTVASAATVTTATAREWGEVGGVAWFKRHGGHRSPTRALMCFWVPERPVLNDPDLNRADVVGLARCECARVSPNGRPRRRVHTLACGTGRSHLKSVANAKQEEIKQRGVGGAGRRSPSAQLGSTAPQ